MSKKELIKITSQMILSLLEDKHNKDIFVTECKDGPTWYGPHFRMDAWAMPKSWSKLRYIGYEIKVSRSDFLQDQKYIEYLNLCNELYFVSPNGLIKPDELTDGIGLIITSKNGNKLYTKKKAKYREIEPPLGLLNYIIMCRSKITKSNYQNNYQNNEENKIEYWQKKLQEKSITKQIGFSISKKIRSEIKERCEQAEFENIKLQNKIEQYKELLELLKEIGITDTDSLWQARRKISGLKENIKCVIDMNILHKTKNNIDEIIKMIDNN